MSKDCFTEKCSAIILSFVFILISFNADARIFRAATRTTQTTRTKQELTNRSINAILARQQAAKLNVAARTSSYPSERLIASSVYNYNALDTPFVPLGINDSDYFVYSGMRGSIYNTEIMQYEAPESSDFVPGNQLNLFTLLEAPYFSPNYNVSQVFADSAYYWNAENTDTNGYAIYALAEILSNTYDVNNNVTLCYDNVLPVGGSGSYINNYVNTYNSDGEILKTVVLYWDGTSWDSTRLFTYNYNTESQLITDTAFFYSGGWAPNTNDNYSYNTAGLLSYAVALRYDTSWYPNQQYYFQYNTDNSLIYDSVTQLGDTGLVPWQVTSFAYTTGYAYWSYLNTYLYNFYGPGTYDKEELIKHINTLGMPDTLFLSEYSSNGFGPTGLTDGFKVGTVYDAYNNPVTQYQYLLNVDSTTGAGVFAVAAEDIYHYYYQNFTSDVSVLPVATATPSVNIFPVPASSYVDITITGLAVNSNVCILLLDMQGRKVLSESLPWITDTHRVLLAGMASGTYIVRITDGKGNELATRQVVKVSE